MTHRNPFKAVLPVLVLLAALAFAPAASAQIPDPLATGPHATKRVANYEVGSLVLQNPGSPGQPTIGQREQFTQYLRGDLHYPDPASFAGPYKVIVHVHGNHANCRTTGTPLGSGESTLFHDCTESFSNQTQTFSPVTGREPLPNDEGYHYMAENLASHGYLVISIDQDEMMAHQPGDDRGMYMRAQLISAHLDALWNTNAGQVAGNFPAELTGKVNFGGIGLMGHSRGGDGVTHFIDYNRTRPAPGRRYDLAAVLSLAPVDYERRSPYGAAYATLLPLCDGDVSNVQGARFFERSQYIEPGDPFPRIQFALHGTNHNYYNSNWANDDGGSYTTSTTGRDLACGEGNQSTPIPSSVRLTRADQEKTGIALMNAFFRRYVGGEAAFEPYMTGESGLPQSACPVTRGVACEEELMTSYFAAPAERLDVLRPENENPLDVDALGGRISGTGFSNPYKDSAGVAPATGFDPPADTPNGYDWCNPEPKNFQNEQPRPTAVKQCPLPTLTAPGGQTGEREQAPVNRSYGNQFALAWDKPAKLTAAVPARYGDVSSYKLLALGAAVNFFDLRNPQRSADDGSAVNPAAKTQDFEVVLIDADGDESIVNAGSPAYGNALHPSLGAVIPNLANNRGRRHILLNEVRIPLTEFEDVDLTRIRKVEFRFGGLTATGSVQLADVRFQETAEPQAFAPVDVTSFPSVAPPKDEPVGTTFLAPQGITPSACVDTKAPTSKLTKVTRKRIAGITTDVGCAGIATVKVSVRGKKTKAKWVTVKTQGGAWSLKTKLPKGKVAVTVAATDIAGNAGQSVASKRLR